MWVGGGAVRLGLDGEVDPDDLRAVLAGLAPGTGGLTPNGEPPRPHPRRVPGFDLTFKAPKSASVLYAVSDDPRVQGAVIEAGEAAMRAALGWLEREAIEVRRGSHNQAWLAAHAGEPGAGPRRLATSGVVAASFRHRTSRAGDPLLHWHVLVANLAEGTDGRWSALVHPDLYRHARAAGEVFQAVFRDELTASLGVEWRPGRHVPEIAGIPQTLLDGFSKRSHGDRRLAGRDRHTRHPGGPPGGGAGHPPPQARGRARTLRRRLEGRGRRRRVGTGCRRAARRLVPAARRHRRRRAGGGSTRSASTSTAGAERVERIVDPEEWIADLLRTELTATASTFTDADLIRAVAARQGHGATVATIERIAARVLASDQVLAVATGPAEPAAVDEPGAGRRRGPLPRRASPHRPGSPPLPPPPSNDAVTGRSLGADQPAAVAHHHRGDAAGGGAGRPGRDRQDLHPRHRPRRLRAGRPSGDRRRPVGPGRDRARRRRRHPGPHAALAARPVAQRLRHARSPGRCWWSTRPGMADIRTLEAVVTRQVAAGGRVLLVGDHHQLPEVGAGGGFAAATAHAGCVAELTVNRRQRQPWEQDALAELRDGTVARAVDAYLAHDRVVVTDDPEAMITAAVDRWFAARDAGLSTRCCWPAPTTSSTGSTRPSSPASPTPASSTAPRRVRAGRVPGRRAGRAAPQQHRTHRPADDRSSVANGQTGHIVAVDPGRLTVRLDRGGDDVVLTDRYLRRGGHLTHGYALTTHRAQGGTWDLAIAVGADGLYREGAYVELSRGATENWLVLTDPEAAQLHRDAAGRDSTATTPASPRPTTSPATPATTSSNASAAPTPSTSPTPSTPTSTASTTSPAPSRSPSSKPASPPP